jgi:hypothetical protein
MNLNHSFESCHVSQAVDGSLVLVNLGGQPGLAFKGFEMLADRERTDLIVTLPLAATQIPPAVAT